MKPNLFEIPKKIQGVAWAGSRRDAEMRLNTKARIHPYSPKSFISEPVTAGATGEWDHLAAKIFFLIKFLGARGKKLPGG